MKAFIDSFDARGGPNTTSMGADGFSAGPTNKGKFVIARCGKHSSRRYPDWSRILWGTPLKEEGGILKVKMGNVWRKLSDFTPVTKGQILDYHEELYGSKTMPNKWVFNDFGHITCYYFKDINGNRRKDGKEKISGEFIHTTPSNEAQTLKGSPVILTDSHGCIHVKPQDVDKMIRKKYLRKGNQIIVHDYSNKAPRVTHAGGSPPFELHFYPGDGKILVKGKI